MRPLWGTILLLAASAAAAHAQEVVIAIQADRVIHPVSRLLTGACIEDVNHEIYGGLYSQMIFGESFQEPAKSPGIPIATSANGLQPDRQNDNGWDQGLLFLNPSQVWLQPPGYVTQMVARNYQPKLVKCDMIGATNKLDATAKLSQDGKILVLQVVNPQGAAVTARLQIAGFAPARPEAQVTELSGPPDVVNPAGQIDAVVPRQSAWKHQIRDGSAPRTFPPHSFTLVRFE